MGMKKKEIFESAVGKAMKNGYKRNDDFNWRVVGRDIVYTLGDKQVSFDCMRVIFSHDFAKAFWGEERWSCGNKNGCTHYPDEDHRIHGWRYHLQQMVIEKDPIKYLERFL
jgi:hypothetical protein